MNTSQLECFTSLAQTLNYQKTADELGLTQPAVSKQIKALENEMGTTLFHRTTRMVSLTLAGSEFLPEAASMLRIYYQSLERSHKFHNTIHSVLRIGYLDPNILPLLSQVLSQVYKEHKNLRPELIQNQTDANLRLLLHNQLDCIVGMRDARFNDENVIFTKLRDEGFLCVIPRQHPLAQELEKEGLNSVTTDRLWPHNQILSIPPYLLKNYFSRGRSIVPVNDDMDNILCSNTCEAYAFLLAGYGYSFIPEHLFFPHPLLSAFSWAETPLSALGIYRRKEMDSRKSTSLSCFVKIMKEMMSGKTDQ